MPPEIFHLDVLWRRLLARSVAVSNGFINSRDVQDLSLLIASSGDVCMCVGGLSKGERGLAQENTDQN